MRRTWSPTALLAPALALALTTPFVLASSAAALVLTVDGGGCPVASTTWPGGGLVVLTITHNDIACCANFGCIGYNHAAGPGACGNQVKIWTDVQTVFVNVSGWAANVGNTYVIDTGASGNVFGQYQDGFCSDNSPIAPWSATIRSAVDFTLDAPTLARPRTWGSIKIIYR
jgi:hypothetical protein